MLLSAAGGPRLRYDGIVTITRKRVLGGPQRKRLVRILSLGFLYKQKLRQTRDPTPLCMSRDTRRCSVPIGAGVDANAFDEQLQLAFSSNGEGTVTIAREESPEKLLEVWGGQSS